MTEPKSLDQRIRECVTSQQISDLQAESSGSIQRVEGTRSLALPVMKPGRVLVRCTRDGDVDLPADQLARALEIDPNLKVIAMGTTNSELEQRISQCHDSAELALLMTEGRKGKL